jgi:Ca2+-transporting ATPase
MRLTLKSIAQGFAVFLASFGTYCAVYNGNPENALTARAMGLAVIMLANLFLCGVNSSGGDFVFRSIARLVKDPVMWLVHAGTLLMLGVILYTPLYRYLKLAPLSVFQLFCALCIALASVLWFEIVKPVLRRKR